MTLCDEDTALLITETSRRAEPRGPQDHVPARWWAARTSPAPPSGARARGPGRGALPQEQDEGGVLAHASWGACARPPLPTGQPDAGGARLPPRSRRRDRGQGAGTPAGLGAGSPQRTATPSRRPRSKRGLESPSLSRRCSDVCGGLGPARPPSARETPAGLGRGTSCLSAEFLSPRGARGVCLENLALIPSVCLNLISKEA